MDEKLNGIVYLKQDKHNSVIFGNSKFYEMISYSKERFEKEKQNSFQELIAEDSGKFSTDLKMAFFTGTEYEKEVHINAGDGSQKWFLLKGVSSSYDKTKCLYNVVVDITNIKNRYKEDVDKAKEDKLTGLLSKTSFEDAVREELLIHRQSQQAALIILDIDSFKKVNDTRGHDVGDRVIQGFAQELKNNFRRKDLIGRFGGDEFVIYMKNVSSVEFIQDRVCEFIESINHISVEGGEGLSFSSSIGIALIPQAGDSFGEIFKHADQALYWMKNSGKNGYHFWTEEDGEIDAKRGEGLDLERISDDELLLEDAKRLALSITINEDVKDVLHTLGLLYGAPLVTLLRFYQDTRTLELIAANREEDDVPRKLRVPVNSQKQLMEFFARNRLDRVVSVRDLKFLNPVQYQYMLERGIQSYLALPLIYQGEAYGCLLLINPSNLDRDSRYLMGIASFLISAVEKDSVVRMGLENLDMDKFVDCYNEYKFQNDLQEFERHKMESFGVLIADVNNLRRVNNTFGQAYGNRLLKSIVRILSDNYGKKHVYRTSGDGFTVLLENISYYDFASKSKMIEEYFSKSECRVDIGYMWEYKNINVNVVNKQAKDMIDANRDAAHDVDEKGVPAHVKSLLEAIKNKQIKMFLQPKTNMETGKITGCEGLARYLHPTYGYIEPNRFIPLLEENRTIRYVDLFIFEEACRTLRYWMDHDLPVIPISVNFSKITLLYTGLFQRIKRICSQYQIDPKLLEIEITESIGSMSKDMVLKLENDFRKDGYSISLDDFGTAYSNMELLLDIIPDRVKIDKSLLDHVVENPKNQIIVKSIIDMCHDLEITVVAEGMERPEQRSVLVAMGCDESQGFVDGQPVPIQEFHV